MSQSKTQRHFGLIGQSISHSFSKIFFSEKFEEENILADYHLFPLDKIEDVVDCIKNNKLSGFNITSPFKESIIPFLDSLSAEAAKIGAVNTVKITSAGLKGYNTDVYGFRESLKPFLKRHHQKALILGTGGASKAVKYVLDQLGLESLFVSRNPQDDSQISYNDINANTLSFFPFIINCTPVGTYPHINDIPNLPYDQLSKNNFLYDLIYNPEETGFMKKGQDEGAQILNGLNMLYFQAEKSWEIWNDENNNS